MTVYNFKNKSEYDISRQLESMIYKELGIDFAHTGAIFDCSRIESESFIDAMEFLLYLKGKVDIDFINKYYIYRMQDMKTISNYNDIFIDFLNLLNN